MAAGPRDSAVWEGRVKESRRNYMNPNGSASPQPGMLDLKS